MKKISMKHLLFLLTIFPLTVFCQDTTVENIKKTAIGLTFSPDYCYRTLKSDASSKWIADIRNMHEIPKLGYTTGMNIAYALNKRIALEAGILYSDKGERTDKYWLFSITPSGQPDPALPTAVSYNYHYIYIDIPVKANYYFLTKRAKLYLTGGVSPNVFITQKSTSIEEYSDGHKKKNSSTSSSRLASVNLAAIGGLGFSYDFTRKFYLKVEPVYRRSIIPIVDAPIKGYLYSIGLNLGIYYKL
jgi:hypothetical protein